MSSDKLNDNNYYIVVINCAVHLEHLCHIRRRRKTFVTRNIVNNATKQQKAITRRKIIIIRNIVGLYNEMYLFIFFIKCVILINAYFIKYFPNVFIISLETTR